MNKTEEFIIKAKKVHGDKYDYSKTVYTRSDKKLTITCLKHGDFEQVPTSHLKGCGCKQCSIERRAKTRTLTTDQFILKARKIHGFKYDYSKSNYTKGYNTVCIICPKHGEFWQIAHSHMQGAGCPKCKYEYVADLQRGTLNRFIKNANDIHNYKYDYSQVVYGRNNKEKVCIVCPEHGEFWQTPHDHLSGYGCPKCKLKGQTRLYNKLCKDFPKEIVMFEVNSKIVPWLKTQRFDIYFPKYNIAIEYNGEQHYSPILQFGGLLGYENTIKRDQEKREKCKNNNCVLFELKYDYTNEDYTNLLSNINNIIKNKNNENKVELS